MQSDIEINRAAKKMKIKEVAAKLEISEDNIEPYGKIKAKIENFTATEEKGKLILVTAISPTPSGEGKTTTTIGLVDGLNRLGKKASGALREPSLGPVFGQKGGATGGGYAQVAPLEDINLHFTGDIHALTSANNLISACIDNHIFQGNELKINPATIPFKRAIDINDRTLRTITVGQGSKINGIEHQDHFQITVATELMAILCLSTDIEDLKERIKRIIIGYNEDSEEVYVKDLAIENSIVILLKDCIKPNLVQTLENNPCFIHGGPFANIAHGCNSLIATKYALSVSDYVVTEAGFGSDLGSEKFIDIKCRIGNLKPNLIVLVATIKSLKYQSGIEIENLGVENLEALKSGFTNLERHLAIVKQYNTGVIVAINKFSTDTELEIQLLEDLIKKLGVEVAINSSFAEGSRGSENLALLALNQLKNAPQINYIYELGDNYTTKVQKVCTKVYQAQKIKYKEGIREKLEAIKELNLPICIAKTPNSFTGEAKILGAPSAFTIEITDVELKRGAGFVIIYVGNVITLPGLSKNAQVYKLDYQNGEILHLN